MEKFNVYCVYNLEHNWIISVDTAREELSRIMFPDIGALNNLYAFFECREDAEEFVSIYKNRYAQIGALEIVEVNCPHYDAYMSLRMAMATQTHKMTTLEYLEHDIELRARLAACKEVMDDEIIRAITSIHPEMYDACGWAEARAFVMSPPLPPFFMAEDNDYDP